MATQSSADKRAPERDAGLLEGVKDRRCVIVAILESGRRVVVMPITGTEPDHDHDHKIPLRAGALGLERQSWIVTSELNVTLWPGHDLRPARVASGAWWRYGRLSDALRQRVAEAMRTLIRAGQAKVVTRT